MEPIVTRVGQRIRALRKARRLTQTALAARCGLSQESLSRMEIGKHSPSLAALDRIALALGVTPASLLDVEPYTHDVPEDLVERLQARLPDDPTVLRDRLAQALTLLLADE